MTNKTYIGKGKVGNFNSIRVTLKMTEAQKFIYENNGEMYLTFHISSMKEPDQFGRSHTAYILEKEQPEIADTAGAEQPAKNNKRKKAA